MDHIARNGSSGGGNNDYKFHNITIEEKISNILNILNRIEEKISIEVVDV